jgi:hypothetical protein
LIEADKNAAYRTIGEEESINWEAISAAQGFEDIKSTMVMRLLQKMMLKEEKGIIGGNASWPWAPRIPRPCALPVPARPCPP